MFCEDPPLGDQANANSGGVELATWEALSLVFITEITKGKLTIGI